MHVWMDVRCSERGAAYALSPIGRGRESFEFRAEDEDVAVDGAEEFTWLALVFGGFGRWEGGDVAYRPGYWLDR